MGLPKYKVRHARASSLRRSIAPSPTRARTGDEKDRPHEANRRLTVAFSHAQWTVEEEDALRDGVRKYVLNGYIVRAQYARCTSCLVRENESGAVGLRAQIVYILTRRRVSSCDAGMDQGSGD